MRPRPGRGPFTCPHLAFVAIVLLASSCAEESESILVDPDAVGTDQGTLVALSDIRSVAAEMVQSMNGNETLSRLRASRKPLRVLVGHFKQRTSIAIFDKDLFVSRLLANLSSADLDRSYTFIRRGSVPPAEVREAAAGTGADFVLTGEVRELLHREPAEGGGELERRTVQYTLSLTSVADDAIVWTDSREIVKQQITGAIYR